MALQKACKIPTNCITTACSAPILPTAGTIFTPYVKIDFGDGNILTTGNRTNNNDSGTMNNYSGITSFQYGATPGTVGWGVDFELIDSDGFVTGIIGKTVSTTLADLSKFVMFDFGWIVNNCNGTGISMITAESTSGSTLQGLLTGLEQTFEANNIKYKIKLSGPQYAMAQYSKDAIFGGDKKDKISLKEALRTLFTQHAPKFKSIKFLDRFGKGETSDGKGGLQFAESSSDKPGEGPMGSWPTNQQNPLAAARAWMVSITTVNKLGVIIYYDPSTGSIVFQEDPSSDLNNQCCGNRSQGTYIVNGGNCSPVLEFIPSINWFNNDATGSGGTPSGAASGKMNSTIQPVIPPPDEIQKAGIEVSPSINAWEWIFRNPDDMANANSVGVVAHHQANQKLESPWRTFDAELKIWGDPKFSHPEVLTDYAALGLIVLNPWRVEGSGFTGCNWITSSVCNPLLSSNNYQITGVSHNISGGIFTTTFNLNLSAPNVDTKFNGGIGGCGPSFPTSKPLPANEEG